MSPDTRKLLIILAIVGVFCFGCMCLPFGVVFVLPALHRASATPAKADWKRPEFQQANEVAAPSSAPANPFQMTPEASTQPVAPGMTPPMYPGMPVTSIPPPGFGPSAMPPGAYPSGAYPPGWVPPPGSVPPPGWIPPPGWRPTGFYPPGYIPPSMRPTTAGAPTGGTPTPGAASSTRTSTRRTSGAVSGTPVGISESQRRTIFKAAMASTDHDALCEKHRIKKLELEQILAEGKRNNW